MQLVATGPTTAVGKWDLRPNLKNTPLRFIVEYDGGAVPGGKHTVVTSKTSLALKELTPNSNIFMNVLIDEDPDTTKRDYTFTWPSRKSFILYDIRLVCRTGC